MTFGFTSQTITESVGATVTQGSVVTLASYQEPSIRTPVTAVSAFGAVDTEGAMNMLDTNNLNTAIHYFFRCFSSCIF